MRAFFLALLAVALGGESVSFADIRVNARVYDQEMQVELVTSARYEASPFEMLQSPFPEEIVQSALDIIAGDVTQEVQRRCTAIGANPTSVGFPAGSRLRTSTVTISESEVRCRSSQEDGKYLIRCSINAGVELGFCQF